MVVAHFSLLALALFAISCIAISKDFYPSSKRGLIFIPDSDFPSDDKVWVKKGSDLTWYYNYKMYPSSVYENYTSLQFVPMLWGAPDGFDDTTFLENVTAQIIGGRNVTYAMDFNEPDNSMANGGSDIKPVDAAKYWIKQLEPLRNLGVSLGAPAVTGAPSGFSWLTNFTEACNGSYQLIPNDGLPGHVTGLSLGTSTPVPMVAIIGDKCSGKTALFEALSGIYLHGSRLSATRFPIHTYFIYTSRTGTALKAGIKPGKFDGQNKDLSNHLQSFEVKYQGDFTAINLSEIVRQATDHMQIATAFSDDKEEEEQQVSDNVLVIEILGPDFFSMEIVDTPGLSSILHLAGATIGEAQELTRALIMDLLRQPNAIILSVLPLTVSNIILMDPRAVVDATNDMSNQEGPKLAQAADVTGNRTVAVVTKCDLVPMEARRHVLRAMRNKERYLGHPWFAARSLSDEERDQDCTLDKRNSIENSFFSQEQWATVKRRRVGALALKHHLEARVNAMLQDNVELLMTRLNTSSHSVAPVYPINSFATRETTDGVQSVNIYATSEGTVVTDTDLEFASDAPRPTQLLNAITVALTVAVCLSLIGLGCRTMALEIASEGGWTRLLLLLTPVPQIVLSLFFCQAIKVTIFQMVGPVTQLKVNSKYYSAKRTRRLDDTKIPLPHVTIQCPVYKEGLEGVIRPTVRSLSTDIRNYEYFSGTASIFADERRMFHKENNINWVARPPHNPDDKGISRFIRRGKFKKTSNMNYALGISLKVEDKLGTAYQRRLDEVLSEELGRACVGGDIRVGDYILLVDSDTRVSTDCLIDAVSELGASPKVAILQFTSGVMNVTTSHFESGITLFTNLIYTAITYAVANGDVSPFVSFKGHDNLVNNGKDPNSTTPHEKLWSESHVSEDFDVSIRLQTLGCQIRLATYCGDGFKEGVSLTVNDELSRWQKYAYGCSELLFYPVRDWWKLGIFTPLFKRFIMSNMPLGSKITIMSYIGTYYPIGYSWIGSLLNYSLIGWLNGELDHYYMSSWRVWVALVVVFSIAGNITLALIRYRSQQVSVLKQLWTCFKWVLLMFVFLGGISMHGFQVCIRLLSCGNCVDDLRSLCLPLLMED
ncbi:glycosyl hydrolase catalytic core-domain-containing protein [Fusarium redolens]|uniref:Glycosyl hydrolase catalytic core-domain-containing protein n=1 Tax=Fusarium redolens TaxID=48865 RepID=A0A9P9FYK6_FUSRE|nr:glycosyl hydrolase catalytic core-domain-containing protein [Fusarium redolens]KAH7220445.1 glycosyl hydrolase catalytic core-domain-containing protein [Fusarium redolens]